MQSHVLAIVVIYDTEYMPRIAWCIHMAWFGDNPFVKNAIITLSLIVHSKVDFCDNSMKSGAECTRWVGIG